jgi:hypothetical protein
MDCRVEPAPHGVTIHAAWGQVLYFALDGNSLLCLTIESNAKYKT